MAYRELLTGVEARRPSSTGFGAGSGLLLRRGCLNLDDEGRDGHGPRNSSVGGAQSSASPRDRVDVVNENGQEPTLTASLKLGERLTCTRSSADCRI